MTVPLPGSLDDVETELARLDGVEAVHELRVCPPSTTETALTAHPIAPAVAQSDALLHAARQMLRHRFHIEHCTLQIERATVADCDHC